MNPFIFLVSQSLVLILRYYLSLIIVSCCSYKMRLVLSIALVLCSVIAVLGYEDSTLEDDDFAEFEQFDAEDDTPVDGNITF